ncbi:MAG: hypothetical protein ACRDS9_24055 [Pseudonocardiaceae bacterium]
MSMVASSSYAVVYGTTVITHTDKHEAIHAFSQVLARHCGAHLFAVSASGTYTNLTPTPRPDHRVGAR